MRTLVIAVLLCGCGSTQQQRRTFPVEVSVVPPSAVLDSGWTVSDLRGSVHFAELRFFSGKVLVAERFDPLSWLVSSAWAHPGHYVPGESMGEVLTALDVDVASPQRVAWGEASAVTGSYGSARLGFGAAGLRLRGTAARGGETIRFDTGVKSFSAPLEGLRFEHEMTTSPGLVLLEVDLSVLLARVAFELHQSAPEANGVVQFAPTSPAFNGFDRGATDSASYRFTWLPN